MVARSAPPPLPEDGIRMPASYADHAICKQIRALQDEEVLQDTDVVFEASRSKLRTNAFLLSVLSPVFHKMVCGAFKESVERRLFLQDVPETEFKTLLGFACGELAANVRKIDEIICLAKLADRLEMMEVVKELEEITMAHMTIEDCAEVLTSVASTGLSKVEEGSRGLALSRFEEVSKTRGFMRMSEEVLASLVDDNRLVADGEEGVFEAVLQWMQWQGDSKVAMTTDYEATYEEESRASSSGKERSGGTTSGNSVGGGVQGGVLVRGHALLGKIRFPLMDEEYLEHTAPAAISDREPWKAALLAEARAVKRTAQGEPRLVRLHLLGPRALVPRIARGVAWERYGRGGMERRLEGHTNRVFALAECAGRVCSGSSDGRIKVWHRASLRPERTLQVGNDAVIRSLTAWQGWLVSGHGDGRVRVWDVGSGRCQGMMQGHSEDIRALGVWGDRLVSGSDDRTVRIWTMTPEPERGWPCEAVLSGHKGWVLCLALWEGKVMSGSSDTSMRVWDLSSGMLEATMTGHTHWVRALAVHGRRVYSSSYDLTIRVWAAGSWEPCSTVVAYGPDSDQCAFRLAISGSKLVSGSADRSGHYDGQVRYEIKVWDLESLTCDYTLPQPPGAVVCSLLGIEGELWAGVGMDVVVWGRRDSRIIPSPHGML